MRWRPGDVILWREVWRGRPWFVWPVRVVEDRDDLLALYVPEGTPFGFPAGSWPWEGGHPWSGRQEPCWHGHGVLTLHRPGCRHSVWVFWDGPERDFLGWYVNLQEPVERTARGVDTCEHELDLWVAPDGRWRYKDDELLDGWVDRGRWTADEVAGIRAEGARVAADLDAGRRWWSGAWTRWKPDPSWTAAALPPGWDEP